MVGDMAIFMTQNDLTAGNIVEKGAHLAFPDSVVSYFEGMMGQPQGGFPEDIGEIVLKGIKPITGRPGELLPPIDFDKVREEITPFCPEPAMTDILSYCLYPKVFKDYCAHLAEYSDLSMLDTSVFLNGLAPGETTEVEIEDGKTLMIKLINLEELDENNHRHIVFELNGFRREVTVLDQSQGQVKQAASLADPANPMEIGASIPGMISKLSVAEGDTVKVNDILAIIEAMKMETTVVSKVDGVIDKIHVGENQPVKAGELIISMRVK